LVRVTPLLWSSELGIWIKHEQLQRTGSFKLRGAALAVGRLVEAGWSRGVVCASAGNHGLGVACASAGMGVAATVVVSCGAAEVKRQGIRRLGAHVEVSAGPYEEAEREARLRAVQTGAAFLSPFDDDAVVEGNGGWLADELRGQAMQQGITLDRVIVPVGGGGLVGGLAQRLAPRGVEVIGVQPRSNCAMYESLVRGRALTTYDGGQTLCEGLEGPVAERTFELCRRHLASIALVDEPSILQAVGWAWRHLGQPLEPSAACALAAVRAGLVPSSPSTVLLLTGRNLDDATLDRALETAS
jgi:threonine dehydratase